MPGGDRSTMIEKPRLTRSSGKKASAIVHRKCVRTSSSFHRLISPSFLKRRRKDWAKWNKHADLSAAGKVVEMARSSPLSKSVMTKKIKLEILKILNIKISIKKI